MKAASEKMLSNEKYRGDALLQKSYTVDFLSKKQAENTGQVPQYLVEDSHPAIIDKETWEAVQLEMERRKAYALEHGIQKLEYASTTNPFAGRVICGCCGKVFGRKVWNSTDERHRRIIWRCNGKYPAKGKKGCASRHVDDKVLYQAFVGAFNMMVENKEYFMGRWREGLGSDNLLGRYRAGRFIEMLTGAVVIESFDVDTYFSMVEKMTVIDGGKIVVSLLDGTGIECEME